MKRTTKRLNTVFLTLLFFITTIIPAMAQPLPSLSQIAACQWVQGQQTAEQALAGKQFVVVEFFSTWCSGCTAFAPELSRIHDQFYDQGVSVVALSDEGPKTLQQFISKFEGGLHYPIGIDSDNTLYSAFTDPFGVNTIPYTFVLNTRGEIVWHGHPNEGLEETLQALVAGNYDVDQFKTELHNAQNLKKSMALFEAYTTVAQFPEEKALKEQLARTIIDCAKSKQESLALLSLIFIHDFKDYPMAALAVETAVSQPQQPETTLESIYLDVMDGLEIPSLVAEDFLSILATYQKDQNRTQLVEALETFAVQL
ncbi:MAG: hypothetical protein C0620_09020 [Desulfuromonas sp.]|nr:MAG: hypothetical protein C0620_09020 [Desulfuromonas sp.]